MYTPKHFDLRDLSLARLVIQEHPLATVILHDAQQGLLATPVPMIWRAQEGAQEWWLEGHVARGNPHATCWLSAVTQAAAAADAPTAATGPAGEGAHAGQVLVQFNGPGAYVSPSHYDTPLSVPTWNYVSLQVRGSVTVIDDEQGKDRLLKRLIATQEPDYAEQWRGLPADFQRKLLCALRVRVETWHLKAKLSQNRSPAERARILAHQEKGELEEQLLARWVRQIGAS